MTIHRRLVAAIAIMILSAIAAEGRDWRVSPEEGIGRVEALLGQVEGGDRILLASGDWDRLSVKSRSFDPPVVIVSESPGAARLDSVFLRDVEGLSIEGFRIELRPRPEGKKRPGSLIAVMGDSSRIHLDGLEITGGDAAGWGEEEWRRAPSGVRFLGHENTLSRSRITNVRHGVYSGTGRGQTIREVVIDGFSGDGVRAVGDGVVIEGNTIRNCVDVDDTHHDGIQSWSLGKNERPGRGVIRDGVVRANRVVEWARDPDPLRCDAIMHGVGFFDGVYEGWTIENNLIVTAHPHGITVMGGRDMRIVNNTVINPTSVNAGAPRIWLRPHKDGRRFDGNVVANNLAAKFTLPESATERANLRVLYPARRFVAPAAFDFRLKADGLERGLADPAFQPPVDIDGRPRPRAGGDPGAFQR